MFWCQNWILCVIPSFAVVEIYVTKISRGCGAPPDFSQGVLQHPPHPRLPGACYVDNDDDDDDDDKDDVDVEEVELPAAGDIGI